MRPAVALALVTLAPGLLGARAKGTLAPHPVLVRLDVIAIDARGRAVGNLQPADFQLSENGIRQSIESLRFIKAEAASVQGGARVTGAPAAPALNRCGPPDARDERDEKDQGICAEARVFGVLLDEFHVSAEAAARARAALNQFIDRDLGPRDFVAVLKPLDSLLAIRATRDRDVVRRAIESLDGRRGDYRPRTAFERNYLAREPARVDELRAQLTTSALNALILHLGALTQGRKAVLLVSEGFPLPVRRRGAENLPTVDGAIRAANRLNVAVYAFDPAIGALGSRDSRKSGPHAAGAEHVTGNPEEEEPVAAHGFETLRALADGTDGRAAADASDAEGVIGQMVRDSSAYYLITYRSMHVDDGEFREVQIRTPRRGVRVRVRKGYWALWPDEAMAAEMLARINAPPAPSSPLFALPGRTSPLIRPWFGLSRGTDGRTRVTFAWEPAPKVPGDRSHAAPPARIVMTAVSASGATVFEGTVNPISQVGAAESGGRAMTAVFDAPPGRLRIRMSIEDAVARVIDSDVRDLAVRDLGQAVVLGTAEILRARNAREFRLLAADPGAAPVAAREFSRAERLIVRVPAYAPDGRPRVAARLVNRLGQPMRQLTVEPLSAAGGRFQIDLPLAGLAPSEYMIELNASSPAGEARDLVGFRVTN